QPNFARKQEADKAWISIRRFLTSLPQPHTICDQCRSQERSPVEAGEQLGEGPPRDLCRYGEVSNDWIGQEHLLQKLGKWEAGTPCRQKASQKQSANAVFRRANEQSGRGPIAAAEQSWRSGGRG